jgi:hypothetical protein
LANQPSEMNLGKPILKKKCYSTCSGYYGIVIYWCNDSRLKKTIKASSTFWNNNFILQEQQKWVTKLFGYDYEIIYKKGKENVVPLMLFPKNMKTKDPSFLSPFLYLIGCKILCTRNGCKTPKVSHLIQQLQKML